MFTITKMKLSFYLLTVFLLTSWCFAGSEIWYGITSIDPADPEWQVISQDDDEIVIDFQLPGFFYEEENGETFFRIPYTQSPSDSGLPNTPIFSKYFGIPQAQSHIINITILDDEKVSSRP